MSDEPPRGLYTSSGEIQADALHRTPVVSYPFGAQPESPSSDGSATNASDSTRRVSVEDPRVMHTRPGRSARVPTAAEEQNGQDVLPADDSSSTLVGHGRTADPHAEPAAADAKNPECAVEPMPQAQALARVRRHILSRNSGTPEASPGRLVAERFSVGWIVYTPAVGGHSTEAVYYVADDGELEETSAAAERSAYLVAVEQRFWLRQALFG